MKYRMIPIEPLIARDARTFGSGGGGARVRSLDWLTQTVAAGSVRTALWKLTGETPSYLRSIAVRGPFPEIGGKFYFPRPLDFVQTQEGKPYQLLPAELEDEQSADMPLEGLLLPSPDTEENFKPQKRGGYWSLDLYSRWLCEEKRGLAERYGGDDGCVDFGDDWLDDIPKDERTHVSIAPETGAAGDGKIFSSTGLDFVHRTAERTYAPIAAALEIDERAARLLGDFTAPVGGMRRLADFRQTDDDAAWRCPPCLDRLRGGDRIRMILATPALFANGWYPGWIGGDKTPPREGILPGTDVRVRLVSAVVGRWQPLSGWCHEKGRTGPKPMRRMVPAGSVYFFEVVAGNFVPDRVWLRSVCDEPQDRLDGFGLALWGGWREHK